MCERATVTIQHCTCELPNSMDQESQGMRLQLVIKPYNLAFANILKKALQNTVGVDWLNDRSFREIEVRDTHWGGKDPLTRDGVQAQDDKHCEAGKSGST